MRTHRSPHRAALWDRSQIRAKDSLKHSANTIRACDLCLRRQETGPFRMMDWSENISLSDGEKAACARRVHRQIKQNQLRASVVVQARANRHRAVLTARNRSGSGRWGESEPDMRGGEGGRMRLRQLCRPPDHEFWGSVVRIPSRAPVYARARDSGLRWPVRCST
jgi:hypothetical protein